MAQDNRTQPPRARGRGAGWVFALLALVAVSLAAYALISKASLAAENKSLRDELERLHSGEEALALDTGETLIARSQLRGWADEATSLTELMARLFPENLVFTDRAGELVYLALDDTLKTHDYDFSRLVTDPKTKEKTYTDDDGKPALKGIDVSSYQGRIDWSKVKADGVEFAYIRAGARGYESGTVFEDDRLEDNLKGANNAGVPVGVYFYSQAANAAEAVEEADFVIERIKNSDITYPVVFDMEEENAATSRTLNLTPAERTDIAIAFCERVAEAGYRPMIYGNMRWFAANLELKRLEEYDKWFAQYFSRPYFPYEYAAWQYSSKGRVDGISGDVDMNIGFVDYSKPID